MSNGRMFFDIRRLIICCAYSKTRCRAMALVKKSDYNSMWHSALAFAKRVAPGRDGEDTSAGCRSSVCSLLWCSSLW